MNILVLLDAVAGSDPTQVPAGPNLLMTILSFGGIFVVMYFLMIRPQRKKDKALKEQMSKMIVGDKVVTIGGITGTIANIKDDEVTISTSVAHTMITFKKSSISSVQKRESN